MSTPAIASSIRLEVDLDGGGPGGTLSIRELLPFPTPGTNLVMSDSVAGSNGTGSASYAARSQFGNLGVSLSLFSVLNGQGAGDRSFGNVFVGTEDDITINGIQAGFIAFDFQVSGSISHTSIVMQPFEGISANYVLRSPNDLGILFGYGQNGLPEFQINTTQSSTTTVIPQSSIVGNTLNVLYRGTALLPFTGGTLSLVQYLSTTAQCSLNQFVETSCSAQGNFYGSALLGGARILDINQQEVRGASINSASGFDYTAEIPGSDIPEPATFFTLGSILLTAVARQLFCKRKQLSDQQPLEALNCRD